MRWTKSYRSCHGLGSGKRFNRCSHRHIRSTEPKKGVVAMPIGKRHRAEVRSTGCGQSPLLATTAVIGLACVAIAAPLAAQSSARGDATRANLDRLALEGLQQRYEAAAASPAYSDVLRQRAQLEAATIRARLEQGDFNVGDRIAIAVQDNADFSNTFTVQPGRVLIISTVGEIPLAGVLSTELQGHLISYISRFLRNPQVQAKALMRLAITGGVAQPGFRPGSGLRRVPLWPPHQPGNQRLRHRQADRAVAHPAHRDDRRCRLRDV